MNGNFLKFIEDAVEILLNLEFLGIEAVNYNRSLKFLPPNFSIAEPQVKPPPNASRSKTEPFLMRPSS